MDDASGDNFEYHTLATGAQQGRFPDEGARAKGRGAPCHEFAYGSSASNDPNRGADLAARFHEPIFIRKTWGESSANFLQAYLNGEVLTSVVMEFVRKDEGGKEVVFETTTLTNATIVSFRRTVGKTQGRPFAEVEEIGLRFETMEIKSANKSVKFDFKNRK